MFNIFNYKLRKVIYFSFIILMVTSCKKDSSLTFSEEIINSETNAIIQIVYPKATGGDLASNTINKSLENHISDALNFNNDKTITLKDAIINFNKSYQTFEKEFPESSQKWEVLIDGEVVYKSPDVISIGINTYIDTGGAHGNGTITFFNFNPETGSLFTIEDLITNSKGFTDLVNKHFTNKIHLNNDMSMEDYFFGEEFKLPTTIGFSDEGVIILYNRYEIASYNEGITEFTIPYSKANSFLKVN